MLRSNFGKLNHHSILQDGVSDKFDGDAGTEVGGELPVSHGHVEIVEPNVQALQRHNCSVSSVYLKQMERGRKIDCGVRRQQFVSENIVGILVRGFDLAHNRAGEIVLVGVDLNIQWCYYWWVLALFNDVDSN